MSRRTLTTWAGWAFLALFALSSFAPRAGLVVCIDEAGRVDVAVGSADAGCYECVDVVAEPVCCESERPESAGSPDDAPCACVDLAVTSSETAVKTTPRERIVVAAFVALPSTALDALRHAPRAQAFAPYRARSTSLPRSQTNLVLRI